MRVHPSVLVVAAVAGLAGATYGTFGTEWKAVLAPVGGSNISGTSEVEEKGAKHTEAEISIKGAQVGSELPWHVHTGKCGSGGGVVGAGTAYPLLKVNDKGEAKSEAKLDIETPKSGDFHVNVHKSAAELGTIVSCGDLALEGAKKQTSSTGGY